MRQCAALESVFTAAIDLSASSRRVADTCFGSLCSQSRRQAVLDMIRERVRCDGDAIEDQGKEMAIYQSESFG
jgi:hypothetical protein